MVKDIPEEATIKIQFLKDLDPFATTHFAEPSRPPVFAFKSDQPLCTQLPSIHRTLKAPHKISNCGLQLQDENNSEFNLYLDLELSLIDNLIDVDSSQHCSNNKRRGSTSSNNSDISDTFANKKYKITLRTALSVRVHNVISKLYNTTGRDLRRALFCLTKVFDDFDFVTEFCHSPEGLNCLIKIGSGEHHHSYSGSDNNFQNYILRAYQTMIIYVDGMEAIGKHHETIRWLYSLINSDFNTLAKQALKILHDVMSYKEEFLLLFLECVKYVDGKVWWWNLLQTLGGIHSNVIDSELIFISLKLLNMAVGVIENWLGLGLIIF